jgi:hypothetical protein
MRILINSDHYIKGTNYYQYPLNPSVDFSGKRVFLSSFSMYNSTFNISSALENTNFNIIWIDGQTYTYTIPSGYYDFDDLNLYIQFCMLSDGLYCKTGNPNAPAYFINLSANTITTDAQISVTYVPTSAEATTLGYQIPSGAGWTFPVARKTPQIVLSSGLQKLCGFLGDRDARGILIPAQSVFPETPLTINKQFSSSSLAILSPSYAIIMTTNLVHSSGSNVPDLLAQLPMNVSIGELIEYENKGNMSMATVQGKLSYIRVSLSNQLLVPLQFKDYEITLTLDIEDDYTAKQMDMYDKLLNVLTKLSAQ